MSAHNRASSIKPAWHPQYLFLGGTPKRLLAGIAGYPVGIFNSLRYRRRTETTPDHELRVDSECFFSIITYYIHPRDQVRQLERAGFTGVEAFDFSGRPMPTSADDPSTFMVYYLAWRAA